MSDSAHNNTNYSGYLRKAMENEANLQKPKLRPLTPYEQMTNCPACGEVLKEEQTSIEDVKYCDNHPQRMYPGINSGGVVTAVFNPNVSGNEENLSKPKYVEGETPKSYLKRFMQTPPTRLSLDMDEYLTDFKKRVQERLEAVCHQALSEGKHGVKVVTNTGDGTIMFEISVEVPFGEIHYHTEHGPAAWFGPY